MADDVVSLRGEANLDDIVRELERIQTELDQLQTKGREEVLIDAEVQAALEEVERLKRAVDQVGTEDEKVEIDAEIGPAVQKLEELSTTYRQRLDEMRRQDTPFEALGRDAREETTQAIRRLRELEREFRQATDRMRRAADDVDFDPASDSARRMQREVAQASRAMIRHLDGLDPEIRQKVTGFDDVRQAARRASQEVKRFETSGLDNAKGSVDRLSGAFRGLSIAANAFFASIIVDRIVRFGREVIGAAAALQDMERSYAALFKSQEEGNRQMERSEELARLLGLSLGETRQQFLNFVVSAQEAGFEADTAAALFESLAISAKGLGGSQEQTNRALTAFSQIISKGKIQAEELRGQLADALPGALSILATEMGKTTQELDKMLEQGELSTEQLIELSDGMLRVFGPAALANIEGTSAEMGRFTTALESLKEIIGGDLSRQMALFLQDLELMGSEGEEQAGRIGEAFGELAAILRKALTTISDVIRGDFAAAFKGIGSIMVGFIPPVLKAWRVFVLGIRDLVGPLVDWIAGVFEDAFKSIASGIGELLQGIADNLPASVRGPILELKADIEGVAEDIGGAFAGMADRAKEGAENLGDGYQGVIDKLEELSDELEEGARVSRSTTDEQVGHQEELQGKVDELRELFRKLIDERKEGAREVTETERKELDKQRELFADFADDVRALLDGVGDVEVTPTVNRPQGDAGAASSSGQAGQLQQQLASLREEKAKLEAQTFLSPEDIQRMAAISDEIFRLEGHLGNATAAAQGFGEALGNFGRPEGVGNFGADMAQEFEAAATSIESRGEKMTEMLTGLIGSESFQDAFSGLDAAAQSRLRSLIGQFLEIQDSVGATEEDIRVFTDAILGEMERAGGAVGQLGEEFRGIDASAVDRAWEALGNLGDKAEEAAGRAEGLGEKAGGAEVEIGKLGDKVHLFTEGLGESAEGTEEAGDKIEELGDKAEEAGEKIDQGAEILGPVADRLMGVGDEAEEAGEKLEDVGESAEESGGKMEEAGEQAKTLQDVIREMGEGVEETSVRIDDSSGKVEAYGGKVREAGEAAEEAKIHIEGAGEKIEIMGQKAEESQEKVKGAGEAATEAAEPMEQLGAAAKKAVEPMEGVAEAADKIAKSEGAPENLRGIAEAAEEAVEPVSAVKDAASGFADALERIGKAEAAEEIRSLIAALEDSAEPFGIASEAAGPFAELMTTLAEVIGTAADELTRTVEQMQLFSELIEAAAALLEEGRLQEGLAALSEALAEASPSFETAAGHLTDMADAVTRISETVQAASDGLVAFAETSADVSEGGQIQALTETFEALLEKTEGVSEDLIEVADSLQRIVDIEEDATSAAEAIGEAIGEMASEERVDRLREMFEMIDNIRDALGEADQKARGLTEGMAKLSDEVEESTSKWEKFAEAMSGPVNQALSQVRNLVNQIKQALGEAADGANETVNALLQLETAIPSIEKTTTAVAALAAQIRAAANAAAELKANLAGVSL